MASRKSCKELEKEFADATIDYALCKLTNSELRKKLTEATRKINEATMKIIELKEIDLVLSYFELQRLKSEIVKQVI
jgi:hypothetical protein